MSPERFNYSKIEDQKQFDASPREKQDEIIDNAHEKALEYDAQWDVRKAWQEEDEYNYKLFEVHDLIKSGQFEEAEAQYQKDIGGDDMSFIAIDALVNSLGELNLERALEIKERYKLSDESLQHRITEQCTRLLKNPNSNDRLEFVIKLKKRFSLSNDPWYWESLQDAVENAIIYVLSHELIHLAISLIEEFSVSTSFLQSSKVQELAKKRLIVKLHAGVLGDALIIQKGFLIPEAFASDSRVENVINHGVRNFLNNHLESKDADTLVTSEDPPLLAKEFFRALDRYFYESGFSVSTQEIMGIAKNDRFGPNLIHKFSQFDDFAKDGVNAILYADASIEEGIDRRGVEYRKRVIGQLSLYKRNPEIVEKLKQHGIEVDWWLNYETISYFELGEADNLTIGEKIRQPVDRLSESLEAYTKVMRTVLNEYKIELLAARIPEETAELEMQIERIKTALTKYPDVQKRKQMELSLAIAEARLSNPKQVPVWDKMHAEFTKLVKFAEDIAATNTLLIALEMKKVEIVDEVSLKEAQKHKVLVWEAHKKLTSNLTSLEMRIQKIFSTVQGTLTSVIGTERTAALLQQMQSEVTEYTDHLNTDLDTIFSFVQSEGVAALHEELEEAPFGEEVLDDGAYRGSSRHVKSLEGRPMSIRIGGRSRQDLYIGNYTTCCIRIDSDYHGAESPIADYVTDLGMQNVLIYDETTKAPVACAWCWIGKRDDTGEVALVVDNVEGWQQYTVNFRTQLEEKLHAYLQTYAHVIGAKVLSQGPDYNDLDVIPYQKQGEWYTKLGGYNRATGYYLEAEFGTSNYGGADFDNGGTDFDM